MILLNEEEIVQKLAEIHPEWKIKGIFLHREFRFKNFVSAFSFMTSVAFLAEKTGHHPNWQNEYNKVTIDLSTHDAGGITDKDFELAKGIDLL